VETAVKYKEAPVETEKAGFSVFIVDDDEMYCHSLAFYLKTHTGHNIYCYSTGEECLNNIHLKPDVIILDYYLNSENPHALNGVQILKQIKRKNPRIKVIILSHQEVLQVATEALQSGAYTYVIKDTQAIFTIKNIIETLSNKKDN
jgi:DNA-binding NarL/FixJ family response regulator